jgi:arylsulfatase A-like enzyme
MRPPNIVVVLSDEHTAAAAGWARHPHVQTPHLDRLTAQGVSFDRAYTNSPMYVPSRLSLMTGQYVHQIGAWDNGVIPHDVAATDAAVEFLRDPGEDPFLHHRSSTSTTIRWSSTTCPVRRLWCSDWMVS